MCGNVSALYFNFRGYVAKRHFPIETSYLLVEGIAKKVSYSVYQLGYSFKLKVDLAIWEK